MVKRTRLRCLLVATTLTVATGCGAATGSGTCTPPPAPDVGSVEGSVGYLAAHRDDVLLVRRMSDEDTRRISASSQAFNDVLVAPVQDPDVTAALRCQV